MCVETLRTGLDFLRQSTLRGHMPKVYTKKRPMNIFPSISLETPSMCVETLRTGTWFSKTIYLRGHMPRFTLKKEIFSYLSPWKPHLYELKPQNRDWFSEAIYLRGYMPRFTLKVNVFLYFSLETLSLCVETLRTGLDFPRQSLWGVTCKGVL